MLWWEPGGRAKFSLMWPGIKEEKEMSEREYALQEHAPNDLLFPLGTLSTIYTHVSIA